MSLINAISGQIDPADNTRIAANDLKVLINTNQIVFATQPLLADNASYVLAKFVGNPISVPLFETSLNVLRKIDPRLAVVWNADVSTIEDPMGPNIRLNSRPVAINLDYISYIETNLPLATGEIYLTVYFWSDPGTLLVFEKTYDELIKLHTEGDHG